MIRILNQRELNLQRDIFGLVSFGKQGLLSSTQVKRVRADTYCGKLACQRDSLMRVIPLSSTMGHLSEIRNLNRNLNHNRSVLWKIKRKMSGFLMS